VGNSVSGGEVDKEGNSHEADGSVGVAKSGVAGHLGGLDDQITVGLPDEVIVAGWDIGGVEVSINGIDVRITPSNGSGGWAEATLVGQVHGGA